LLEEDILGNDGFSATETRGFCDLGRQVPLVK